MPLGGDDHGEGSLDAWTTLAGLAARTERIRLGTMVSPATFRHPSVLARAATTVDHISGGRAELGLGAGWHEREHAAFGFPFAPLGERMDVFEEQADVIVGQWTTAPFSYAGRALPARRGRRAAAAGAAAAPAADHRRLGPAARRSRSPSGWRRSTTSSAGTVAECPRPAHAPGRGVRARRAAIPPPWCCR